MSQRQMFDRSCAAYASARKAKNSLLERFGVRVMHRPDWFQSIHIRRFFQDNNPYLKVFVNSEEARRNVPREWDGVQVRVEVGGEVRK